MSKTSFVILIVNLFLLTSYYAQAQSNITKEDVQNYLDNKYKDCVEQEQYRWAVIIDDISFYDVNNDGKDDAIVVASSCYSGTGGPDIHGVYAKDYSGKIVELTINDNIKTFEGKPIYDNLVGNRNYKLLYENNFLVEKFHDVSDRKDPLTLYFKWNGKEFDLAKVEKAKTFKTSFNCANAKTEAEKTICGNAELAALDLKLDFLYKAVMSKLPGKEREKLKDEQKKWKKKRDNYCCSLGIVSCLLEMYKERIKFLTKLSKRNN